MSINEEKKPMFFVWEKRQGEVRGITYSAARYREMPMTGTGQKRDAERYVLVRELKPEEETDDLNVLITRYPCPIKPEGKTIISRNVDLSRNEQVVWVLMSMLFNGVSIKQKIKLIR